ncbi:MAG: hypothetical protein O6649_04295 [Gammaproteobacteria bacterium]|nr:hypothetical protein [Gammaproteobacteria bacterium]
MVRVIISGILKMARIQADINGLFDRGRNWSMNIPRVIIIAATSLLFIFSIFAQTAVSLTPQNIEGFIDSVRDLQEIAKKYNAGKIVNPDISGGVSMAGAVSPFSTAISTGHQNALSFDFHVTAVGGEVHATCCECNPVFC